MRLSPRGTATCVTLSMLAGLCAPRAIAQGDEWGRILFKAPRSAPESEGWKSLALTYLRSSYGRSAGSPRFRSFEPTPSSR